MTPAPCRTGPDRRDAPAGTVGWPGPEGDRSPAHGESHPSNHGPLPVRIVRVGANLPGRGHDLRARSLSRTKRRGGPPWRSDVKPMRHGGLSLACPSLFRGAGRRWWLAPRASHRPWASLFFSGMDPRGRLCLPDALSRPAQPSFWNRWYRGNACRSRAEIS